MSEEIYDEEAQAAVEAVCKECDELKERVRELEKTQFTRGEIDAIRRMFAERWPRPRKLSEIDQSIIDKCDAILKGAAE